MKPDWATRLQRTFARKYDEGFAKGLMLGKAVGARDEQERIIKLLTDVEDWNTNDRCDCQMCANRRAIEQTKVKRLVALIKGENK